MAKLHTKTSNYEIDLFLLQEGICLKSEDMESSVATPEPRKKYKDRFLIQENASSRKNRAMSLKNSKLAKIWNSATIPKAGHATRYWTSTQNITARTTERKDVLRVRKSLDASAVRLAEYYG